METVKERRLPADFKEFQGSDIMSNFDGVIDLSVSEAIKNKPLYAGYPAWNYYGKVWYDGGWHCEIWQHGAYLETISGSLSDIINESSSKYGYE